MKKILSKFLLIFAASNCLLVISGNSYCGDAPLPSEVQKLVGIEIPPVVKGKASGSIPGFLALGSSAAVTGSGFSPTIQGREIGFETGTVNGLPMLFVTGHDKDLTTRIFDVLMLPPDLNDWYFEGDFEYALQYDQAHPDRYFKWRKNRFTLSETCWSHKDDERYILGLIKQEKGKKTCSHYSKRVKLAWMIDKQSGRLTPLPTQGLQCHYITEEDCY
jgi:hypothetical protein